MSEDAVDPAVRAKFERLKGQWHRECDHLSRLGQMCTSKSYLAIIGMGPAVVPLLIEELRVRPHWWFWALEAITEENPASEEDQGRLHVLAAKWIAWYDARTAADPGPGKRWAPLSRAIE